jgi:enolase
MFEVEDLAGRELLELHASPKAACGCGLIETGSASRGDRIAIHNRWLRIEGEIGSAAMFAGRDPFAR